VACLVILLLAISAACLQAHYGPSFSNFQIHEFSNYTAMTAADKYFLKAKDNYPFCLDEAIEALEYGLACDNEHAGLLTLQATIYFKDLKQFEAAKECYELALFYNSSYVDAWYAYIGFATAMKEYAKVEKLVAGALQVKGVDTARVLYLSARCTEAQGEFALAVSIMKKSKVYCSCSDCYKFYEDEIERIITKTGHIEQEQRLVNIIVV
jgi:tetratricopeptide (TPR) repeat protein